VGLFVLKPDFRSYLPMTVVQHYDEFYQKNRPELGDALHDYNKAECAMIAAMGISRDTWQQKILPMLAKCK
jgi:hypothetical protein